MVGSLPHDWNCFWPTLRWASFINDPAAGSLHQCHTPVEQISASDGPWGTIPGLRRISSGAVCLQPCCSSTHGTELGHFQNDHMLTKAAEATIRKDDIPFDLFHYSNSLNKISSAQISSRFLSPVNSFCHIRWTKLNVGMKTVPGKLLYVLSINVRIYIYSYQSNLDKCRPEQGENNIHRTHRIQFFVNAHTHTKKENMRLT